MSTRILMKGSKTPFKKVYTPQLVVPPVEIDPAICCLKLTAILPFQKSEWRTVFHVNTKQITNELGCLIGVPLVCNFERGLENLLLY